MVLPTEEEHFWIQLNPKKWELNGKCLILGFTGEILKVETWSWLQLFPGSRTSMNTVQVKMTALGVISRAAPEATPVILQLLRMHQNAKRILCGHKSLWNGKEVCQVAQSV